MTSAQNQADCSTYHHRGETYLGGDQEQHHFHMLSNWNNIAAGNGHVKFQPSTRYKLKDTMSEGQKWKQIASAIVHLDENFPGIPNYTELRQCLKVILGFFDWRQGGLTSEKQNLQKAMNLQYTKDKAFKKWLQENRKAYT